MTDQHAAARQARDSRGARLVAGVARDLSELARDLQAETGSAGVMHRIVVAAVRHVPNATGATITLLHRGVVTSAAASDDIARQLGGAEARAGEGPCVDSSRNGVTLRSDDLAGDVRWPEWRSVAAQLGIRSVMSFQLFIAREGLGALNVYADTVNAFDDVAENIGLLLAAHGAVAMSAARATDNLQVALASRDVIGQAKGIVMERFKTSESQAFDLLVAASHHGHPSSSTWPGSSSRPVNSRPTPDPPSRSTAAARARCSRSHPPAWVAWVVLRVFRVLPAEVVPSSASHTTPATTAPIRAGRWQVRTCAMTDPTASADTDPDVPLAPGDTDDPTLMLTAFAELQGLLLADAELAEFLRQVAVLAARVVPGSSCGITLRRDNEVATVASSDGFALAVDEIQYGAGDGPCLQAMTDNAEIAVPDLAADDRWGEYRVHAVTRGVRSSLSIPLAVDGTAIGALNLYSREPDVFVGTSVSRGREFARQAATALTVVLRRADQTELEAQLTEALATRAVIDQAIGILMGQRRVTATAAFAVLREASQHQNRKLAAVAADLIETFTGQPPTPPRPFTPPR